MSHELRRYLRILIVVMAIATIIDGLMAIAFQSMPLVVSTFILGGCTALTVTLYVREADAQ